MLDLTSFGYISVAYILQVEQCPNPNSVAIVSHITPTIAADAPIVSLIFAHLGMRSGLITNNIGDDENGKNLIQLLSNHNVQVEIETSGDLTTPQMFDVCDPDGNRILLSFIPNVVDQLLIANLNLLDSSRLAYIDLYTEISRASLRTIDYAIEKDIPVFVNLSRDNLFEKIIAMKGHEGITIIQASLDLASRLDPQLLASTMLQETGAEIALVTLGSEGALGAGRLGFVQVPTYRVGIIKTTFGAGAAFSAGFAYAYLNKWNLACFQHP